MSWKILSIGKFGDSKKEKDLKAKSCFCWKQFFKHFSISRFTLPAKSWHTSQIFKRLTDHMDIPIRAFSILVPCKPGSWGLGLDEGLNSIPCNCCQCPPSPLDEGYPGRCENRTPFPFWHFRQHYQGITERLDMRAKDEVTRAKKRLDPIAHLLTHLI